MKNYAISYLSGAFMGASCMFLFMFNNVGNENETIIEKEIHHHYDTLAVPFVVEIPIPYKVEVPYPVPSNVDTSEILKRFFSLKVYENTYEDSVLKIDLIDSVSRNMIVGRSIKRSLLIPLTTTVINNPVQKQYVNGFYIGPEIIASNNNYGLLAGGSWVNKNASISGAVGLINTTPAIKIGYKWRIASKK
ncbi:MAG: hypothetical protein EP332_06330 [Bacteroidetes bacterium]|nr:MAG: hypothetical protein EP332_06330 [Bacteroidota bacterium]